MASTLVPLAALVAYLGDVDEDDTTLTGVLTTLIDDIEVLFLSDCGRPDRPFGAAEAGRVEVHDGTGTPRLYLDYPITALTSVVLGLDTSDPDDTLDVADKTELAWQVGGERLVRTDGGTFGSFGSPDYVHITYDAAADEPRDAALAITQAAAMLYRRFGSEGLTGESIGPHRADFAALFRDDPTWKRAVDAHRVVTA